MVVRVAQQCGMYLIIIINNNNKMVSQRKSCLPFLCILQVTFFHFMLFFSCERKIVMIKTAFSSIIFLHNILTGIIPIHFRNKPKFRDWQLLPHVLEKALNSLHLSPLYSFS